LYFQKKEKRKKRIIYVSSLLSKEKKKRQNDYQKEKGPGREGGKRNFAFFTKMIVGSKPKLTFGLRNCGLKINMFFHFLIGCFDWMI
jgi:hypothetical protein